MMNKLKYTVITSMLLFASLGFSQNKIERTVVAQTVKSNVTPTITKSAFPDQKNTSIKKENNDLRTEKRLSVSNTKPTIAPAKNASTNVSKKQNVQELKSTVRNKKSVIKPSIEKAKNKN